MLILTRKSGQSFRIGEDIVVTITEIQGDKVRIGIDAPKTTRVLREELLETVESNRQAAAKQAGSEALSALADSLRQNNDARPFMPRNFSKHKPKDT